MQSTTTSRIGSVPTFFLKLVDALAGMSSQHTYTRTILRSRALVLWALVIGPIAFLMAALSHMTGEPQINTLALIAGGIGIVGSIAVLRYMRRPTLAGRVFGGSVLLGLAVSPLLSADMMSANNVLLITTPVIFAFMVDSKTSLRATFALLIYFTSILALSGFSGHILTNGSLFMWFACFFGALGTGLATIAFAQNQRKLAHKLRLLSGNNFRMAQRDELTNCHNRRAFNSQVSLLSHKDSDLSGLLLLIDLDDFKAINDTYGHDVGDQLLKIAADRIGTKIRSDASLYRMGGDEFAVLDVDVEDQETARLLCERIISIFDRPIRINGHSISSGLSVGVAQWSGRNLDAQKLYKDADIALYRAKSMKGSSYSLYDKQVGAHVERNRTLEQLLRDAVKNEDIEVWFQPQYDLRTGKTCAIEALARWRTEDFGWVSPAEFVELAERSHLISAMDELIFNKALIAAKRIMQRDPSVERMGMNVSAASITDRKFASGVKKILAAVDFKPHMLELEIAENALVENWDGAKENLLALSKLGVSIAIDDFGTGYSALKFLSELPVQRLKIDSSFIKECGPGRNLKVLTAIFQMARAMDIEIVAEGVETNVQEAMLKSLHCRFAQGYNYARPMSAKRLTAFLSQEDSASKFRIAG